jgi:acetyltransferase-like isoleucine patch superfamily enzyme
VKIGSGVHIGREVLLETAYPEWISIGRDVQIGIRTMILAHIHGLPPKSSELDGYVSVRVDDEANIGAGVIILPHVTVGHGAVVTAGSVVARSVAPLTMVQGNPARAIATCESPLSWDIPLKKFYRGLKPIQHGGSSQG